MQVNQAEVEEQRGTVENFASLEKERELRRRRSRRTERGRGRRSSGIRVRLQRKVATSDVAAVAIVGSVVAPH